MATTYTELLRGYFMVPTFLLMTAVIPLLRSLSLDSQDKFVCDTTCQYELICIAASCFLVIFWCVFGALPWIFWLLPLYAVRSPRDLHTTRDSAAQSSSTGQCSACEQILVKSGLLNGKERHLTRRVEWHSFRNQYLESLRGGQVACQICTLLLERFVPPTDGERSYGTFGSQSRDIEENPYLRIWQPLLEEGATYMQLYWSGNPVSAAFNIQEGFLSSYNIAANRNKSTKEDQAMQRAIHWINRCSEYHEACAKRSAFLPSRLIKISSDGKTAKIITTSSLESEPYVALSHCWGGDISVTLNLQSYATLCRGFEVEILPKNFLEATEITQSLGYQYLWIDSLCILQGPGSEEDWKRESASMANVYENAVCTLSATASANSEGGCFRTRDEFFYRECVLLRDKSKNTGLYIVPEQCERHKTLPATFREKVETSPLNQRAWAFQERLLSKRILHFGGDGFLLFECNTLRASENSVFGERYEIERYFHRDGRAYSRSDLVERQSPRERYENSISQIIQYVYYALSPDENRSQGVNSLVLWILYHGHRGALASSEELSSLQNASSMLRPHFQFQLQSDWRSLAYEYACLGAAEDRRSHLLANAARTGIRGALDMLYSLRISNTGTKLDERLEIHRRWFELVTEYSSRGLTNRTDKLIAMSGLAKRIAEKSHMTYYAGLWKTSMEFDLLWMSKTSESVARPDEFVAPSWSWASAAGEVVSAVTVAGIATGSLHGLRNPESVKIHAHILDVSVFSAGGETIDPTKVIDRGFIKLVGPMKAVSLSEYRSSSTLDFKIDDDQEADFACMVICSKGGTLIGKWLGLLLMHIPEDPAGMYKRCGVVCDGGFRPAPYRKGWKTGRVTVY